MNEKAVIDRIVDGRHAVLLVGEAETERVVPVDQLPAGAREGAWLRVRFEGDQLVESALDPEETERARQRVGDKMAQLRARPRHFQPVSQAAPTAEPQPDPVNAPPDSMAAAEIPEALRERWTAVDHYLTDLFVPPDPVLEQALATSAEAGLPDIHVAPNQGKLLQLLAQLQGARNILEIGTLGGYSTIWLARALPQGGRLITLEANARHAEVARANLDRAGLSDVVEVRQGQALDSLARLEAEGLAPFDLIFIDADKPGYAGYFTWALKLSQPGSLIVADNVIRKGAVIEAASSDANVQGVRRFNERVAAEPRVSTTAVQTVGSKGYDGLVLALVIA
jgi:predicted O-methyltransferase YrrM